jgi:hypothetical protein
MFSGHLAWPFREPIARHHAFLGSTTVNNVPRRLRTSSSKSLTITTKGNSP